MTAFSLIIKVLSPFTAFRSIDFIISIAPNISSTFDVIDPARLLIGEFDLIEDYITGDAVLFLLESKLQDRWLSIAEIFEAIVTVDHWQGTTFIEATGTL
jgi:hypothetical protein